MSYVTLLDIGILLICLFSPFLRSMYGGTCSWSFGCKACGSSFTKTSSDSNAMKSAPITRGPEYCYVGSHSIKPIQEHDQRRVRDDTLVLYTGPDLQSQINQIPSTHPNVSVLTIQSHSGFYDDSVEYSLEVAMPKLTKVQLIDVSFSHVKLDNELTPLVEELFMQNIPDECNLTVLLPELKSFTMFYYGPTENEEWISKMLTTAKKLKTFESYKLRVGELHFASNELETIRLHRAELMCYLSVYAPKLKMLNLQACYDLNEIKLLDEHPNFIKPAGAGSKFTVDTTNACITRSIANTLEQNPRVEWIGRDDDDDMMFGY